MHQFAKCCKHVFFVGLSAVFFSSGLSIFEKPVFGVQDDIDGYIEFDGNSGFSAYDVPSDTVVLGEFDSETGMIFGSTESLDGVQLGCFAFDTETGDIFHYDLQSGDLSEHNVFGSARSAASFAQIGPVVKAAVPVIIKGGIWVGGKIVSATIGAGGKIVGGVKSGGRWLSGKIWPPKVKTAKELAEEQYIRKLMEKGAKNKSVEKIDPTDIHF